MEAYFDWTASCRFNWLDGVDLKLRSFWSFNSLTRFGRCDIRIECQVTCHRAYILVLVLK